jgi:hypothetical protein
VTGCVGSQGFSPNAELSREETPLTLHHPTPDTPGTWADELLARSVETGDNELAARLRAEARSQRGIEDAFLVAAALDVVERATAQVSRAALQAFAERLGRAYGRAMARLRAAERLAVRTAMRAAAGTAGRPDGGSQ